MTYEGLCLFLGGIITQLSHLFIKSDVYFGHNLTMEVKGLRFTLNIGHVILGPF